MLQLGWYFGVEFCVTQYEVAPPWLSECLLPGCSLGYYAGSGVGFILTYRLVQIIWGQWPIPTVTVLKRYMLVQPCQPCRSRLRPIFIAVGTRLEPVLACWKPPHRLSPVMKQVDFDHFWNEATFWGQGIVLERECLRINTMENNEQRSKAIIITHVIANICIMNILGECPLPLLQIPQQPVSCCRHFMWQLTPPCQCVGWFFGSRGVSRLVVRVMSHHQWSKRSARAGRYSWHHPISASLHHSVMQIRATNYMYLMKNSKLQRCLCTIM